jgi:chromosome condensin MukBEF complex kleisin-like MukF subunit
VVIVITLLGNLTNTDAVRAVIGVSEAAQELTDAYFTARRMEGALRLELSTWLPATLEELEDAADAADEGADEILVWDACQQAAAYWCAWEVLKSAPIALFQKLEDGQNAVTRPALKQKELLDLMSGSYMKYRDQALGAYNGATATASLTWLSGKAVPTFDPITGS